MTPRRVRRMYKTLGNWDWRLAIGGAKVCVLGLPLPWRRSQNDGA